jgi:hypothetical protein
MVTPHEGRNLRLKNDYREMCNIRSSEVSWKATRGQPPFVDVYELDIQIQTIVGPGPSYRSTHRLKIELPPEYPNKPPNVIMLTAPPPFHPNWFTNGKWCPGPTPISEGLGEHIVRMVRTLQFDPDITNPESSANRAATDWYRANLTRGLFPTDRTSLPDPTTSRIVENRALPRKFVVER